MENFTIFKHRILSHEAAHRTAALSEMEAVCVCPRAASAAPAASFIPASRKLKSLGTRHSPGRCAVLPIQNGTPSGSPEILVQRSILNCLCQMFR